MSARTTTGQDGQPPPERPDWLAVLAGTLALVVAAVHLYWGIPRFTVYAAVGVMPDPRPLAFVLSGHAILIAVTLVAGGVLAIGRTYVPGMVLMGIHLVSYAAWHTVLSHGLASGTGGDGHAHLHVGTVAWVVLQHVLNSPLALVSKTAELALLVVLGGLYVSHRRG